MKLTVEQIPPAEPEEIFVRCHDTEQPWVKAVQNAAAKQVTMSGTMLFLWRCPTATRRSAGSIFFGACFSR